VAHGGHNRRMAQTPVRSSPFSSPDAVPPGLHAMLLGALDRMAAHPEIRRVRRTAVEALRPAAGQRLLDAGCGAGEVARDLAAVAAPAEVVALDLSPATVSAARERHDGSAVRYVTGDVAALDFPDGSFDGVRSERVLQHVADPGAVVAELIRVTRPGGRVCLIDTDWDSLAFDGLPDDLVAGLVAHLRAGVMRSATGRRMGRTLRGRLVRAGLADVSATAVTCVFDTPDSAAQVLPMANPQVPAEADMFPDGVRDEWFAAVGAAGARGDFLAVLTIWVAAGTRPA
jgi:SAM-dependent methyltransferase